MAKTTTIKPTALKKLEGTYRKDRVARNEMGVSGLPTMPAPPDFLEERGREVWYKCTEELSALGMLHGVDMELLASYCLSIQTFEKMARGLMVEGHTIIMTNKGGGSYAVKNPKFTMMNESLDRAHKIAVQFGWTPAARTKISAPGQQKEEDPFEKLARG
jgi:P27 family predicted phage terminase small subunit